MAETEAVSETSIPSARHTIAIRDLDVTYKVYEDAALTARRVLARGLRSRTATKINAIRSVSFDVHAGEAIGLVGSNGSGKSTLLRTIAGLQPRTGGSVHVSSQPYFLGVQAALKLRVSGYRNVYLGGLALGLSKREIADKMDEIVEFSGLGRAMSRPMQTYSAGMRSRLAFSIATLRTPEILLLDEALAVGDRAFRERSVAKINEIRADANSILLVTHNLTEIRETCDRVVWLDEGKIVADGPVEETLEAYQDWSDGLSR